ncbi:DMT family transporter [Propionibacterium freudenreichii]|uniref:Membrane spanning protein DUF6 n=2 Tax=Propionibacterium freudenreichii TaxID=1744 RepID=A0A0A8PRP0_9ACTN|nr:DMT family transporter [Propionibacterium freudenreichii]AWY95411.1 Membrane spanning protein DUF6 [Propionibacterium freudenreichii]MCQ1997422.1 DMT family transporter [Propionibacterium freudenreichii]MCT2974249.1 DMT family transporter [Propionibacterium freudenreichii]MCT2989767.1 DMT family transporter [Propionibacterium freudenreichii]MCT3003821.1 DMT family transporter [Propionibacterium freudenreichii]
MSSAPEHPAARRLSSLPAASALLLIAMLWGSSYFMNKALVGMMPPGDITAVRFTMSAIVLALVAPRALRMSRRTLLQGIAMGTAYGIAQLFLMFGIVHTSASVSGFLTGMYAVFTAVMVALILRRNPPPRVWISVGLATAALGVLTLAPGATGGLGLGELLSIAAAVGFAAHIVLTDMFIDQRRVMSLAIVQTATVAVWSLAVAAPGGITMPHGTVQWGALIYLGVLCGALTLFLQAWGQARMEASRAAVIMSSEPLWAAVFAVLAGQEALSVRTVVGGTLMMGAIWLAVRIPPLRRRTDPPPTAAS